MSEPMERNEVTPGPRGQGLTEEERVSALLEVGRALGSTLDLDELLALVMGKTTHFLNADRSTLFLVDEETGEIWSKIAQGAEVKEIRLPIGKGIAGWVARHGRSLNIKDVYRDARFNPAVDKETGYRTTSCLCVPLFDKSAHLVGVIQVLNKRTGHFSSEDEGVLTAVASQAAVALENAKLYRAVVQKNIELTSAHERLRVAVAELDLLWEIERVMSQADDLAPVLDHIVSRAMAVCRAEAGSVLVVEESTGELYFKTALGEHGDEVKQFRLALGQGIVGAVVRSGEAIVANDPSRERAWDSKIAHKLGITTRSVVCVPIHAQGETIGALELVNQRDGAFTAEHVKLLTLLAGQAARAIQVGRGREQRDRAMRLAAIGQLMAGVLHDFRSPMTIVSARAELMALEKEEAARRESSQSILRQLDRMQAMIREILQFARGEREVLLRKVSVGKLLEDTVEQLRKELPAHVRVELKADYRGMFRLDEGRVLRLIHNLARNAGQALVDGGTFTISSAREGAELVLTFADDGPGIPEELEGRLFETFVTRGKQDGTGLGLAIVKKVVEDHGGTIDYASKPGEGTVFTVRLPAADEA